MVEVGPCGPVGGFLALALRRVLGEGSTGGFSVADGAARTFPTGFSTVPSVEVPDVSTRSQQFAGTALEHRGLRVGQTQQ